MNEEAFNFASKVACLGKNCFATFKFRESLLEADKEIHEANGTEPEDNPMRFSYKMTEFKTKLEFGEEIGKVEHSFGIESGWNELNFPKVLVEKVLAAK